VADEEFWPSNYFNYFTEVEEHFQRARGTGMFLLSTLDWALIESWKDSGIPLEAVLRGIDAAFEKWRQKRTRTRMVNSVAYCAQAVMEEAQAMAGAVTGAPAPRAEEPPFSLEELQSFLEKSVLDLRQAAPVYEEIAAAVERLLADCPAHYQNLEELEQRLTAIEEKMVAIARIRQSEEDGFAARRQLDLELKPYRGKMTADQLAMLEKQYLDRRLLESAGLPRLSLFYLR
jgi:hypothetical protein